MEDKTICLIIHRRVDAPEIPKDYIDEAASDNRDGFGLLLRNKDGVPYPTKTLDMKSCLPWIRQAEKENKEFLAHFRLATHGEKNTKNVHPFYIGNKSFLMHNGILPITIKKKEMSDTWHLAEAIKTMVKVPGEKALVDFFEFNSGITARQKLAVMTPKETFVYNKELGTELGGNWYSNTNFLTSTRYSRFSWKNYYDRIDYGLDGEDIIQTSGSSGSISLSYMGQILYDALAGGGDYSIEDFEYLTMSDILTIIEELPEEIAFMLKYGD